jgi:hypothetical protein
MGEMGLERVDELRLNWVLVNEMGWERLGHGELA